MGEQLPPIRFVRLNPRQSRDHRSTPTSSLGYEKRNKTKKKRRRRRRIEPTVHGRAIVRSRVHRIHRFTCTKGASRARVGRVSDRSRKGVRSLTGSCLIVDMSGTCTTGIKFVNKKREKNIRTPRAEVRGERGDGAPAVSSASNDKTMLLP